MMMTDCWTGRKDNSLTTQSLWLDYYIFRDWRDVIVFIPERVTTVPSSTKGHTDGKV